VEVVTSKLFSEQQRFSSFKAVAPREAEPLLRDGTVPKQPSTAIGITRTGSITSTGGAIGKKTFSGSASLASISEEKDGDHDGDHDAAMSCDDSEEWRAEERAVYAEGDSASSGDNNDEKDDDSSLPELDETLLKKAQDLVQSKLKKISPGSGDMTKEFDAIFESLGELYDIEEEGSDDDGEDGEEDGEDADGMRGMDGTDGHSTTGISTRPGHVEMEVVLGAMDIGVEGARTLSTENIPEVLVKETIGGGGAAIQDGSSQSETTQQTLRTDADNIQIRIPTGAELSTAEERLRRLALQAVSRRVVQAVTQPLHRATFSPAKTVQVWAW
jgi:hypothetical protein